MGESIATLTPPTPLARFIRATWEDVDVDDGEGVCVYVDDDVDAEQRHAELRAQLSDERRHGLRAGRREVGHLLIQLGGERRANHTRAEVLEGVLQIQNLPR